MAYGDSAVIFYDQCSRYNTAIFYSVGGIKQECKARFAVGVAGVRPRLEKPRPRLEIISKNVAGVAFWPPQLTTAIREVRPDDRYYRYCDQSVDIITALAWFIRTSNVFQVPTQLLQHKSWTSFAARRTSRLTVWPAPVIHHRSCRTSLNCSNLVNVVSSMW